eukprot:3771837-Rhodomonas_salina.3
MLVLGIAQEGGQGWYVRSHFLAVPNPTSASVSDSAHDGRGGCYPVKSIPTHTPISFMRVPTRGLSGVSGGFGTPSLGLSEHACRSVRWSLAWCA